MNSTPPNVTASVGQLASRVSARLRPGERRLLGITGPPGAGKSTLAFRLQQALGPAAVVVPQDGFHLANEILVSRGLRMKKGAPETFDAYGFIATLERLRARTDPVVYAPRFDRGLEQSIGSALAVGKDVPLVIVEGNYLLFEHDPWNAVRRYLDSCWYLDVPDPDRISRLLARHESFGRSAAEAEKWVRSNDEHNADIVRHGRERADLVVTVSGR